jgi:CDP-glucose 4,6-dehydratase
MLRRSWGKGVEWRHDESDQPHEAKYLKLDSSKARSALSWSPVLDLTTTLDWIIEWYQRGFSANEARDVTLEQIRRFQQQAVQ